MLAVYQAVGPGLHWLPHSSLPSGMAHAQPAGQNAYAVPAGIWLTNVPTSTFHDAHHGAAAGPRGIQGPRVETAAVRLCPH